MDQSIETNTSDVFETIIFETLVRMKVKSCDFD